MKSPWRWSATLVPDETYLVLASLIPPRSRRSIGRLFSGSRVISRQLEHADGLVGYALLARPLRKEYATLSIWHDRAALDEFARSEPHRVLMHSLSSEMSATTFVEWTITGADGRPSWTDALRRLADDRPGTSRR